MKTKQYQYLVAVLLLACFMLTHLDGRAQKKKEERKPVEVTIEVTDENGVPLPDAEIVIGEGVQHLETDANGKVNFSALPEDNVSINVSGYQRSNALVNELKNNGQIALVKSKMFMTSEDMVPLPFASLPKRQLVGSSTVISGRTLESYPSTDLRNALTGLMPGLNVVERSGAPGLSAEETMGRFNAFEEVNTYVRGLEPIVIIDGIPRQITEIQLDPQEVESVTLIKDITAKAMFGPAAANGVLYITTKRGRINERVFNVNAETGVSTVDRFPRFVDAVDYANLNNLARSNNGLEPIYDQEALNGYAKNDPYDLKYPNANFQDMILKDQMGYRKVNVSSSGGNEEAQYYAYLGYAGEDDLFRIGAESNFNRLNARSNTDLKLNDYLKLQFDFYGQLTFRKSPNYGYDGDAGADNDNDGQLDLSEFTSMILHRNTIPSNAFPIHAAYDSASSDYWYGVSSAYDQNPIGNMLKNGYYTESGRTGLANIGLDYDMSHIIPGLTSKTYGSFDVYTLVRIGKAENYTAYIVSNELASDGVSDTTVLTRVHAGVDQSDEQKLHDFYYNRYGFYQNFTYDQTFGKHKVNSTLTYFLSKFLRNQIEEPQRQQNVVWMGNYNYNDKYSLQAVVNYAGTYSFDKENRYDFFPSVGASWVISEEPFLKNVKFLNYLKLRAQGGILGYEGFISPYYWRSRWNVNSSGTKFGPSPVDQWLGANEDKSVWRTSASRIGNPDITWETRREFSLGMDALMLDNSLYFEVNYYNNRRNGQIEQMDQNIPWVTGLANTRPYANYRDTRYYGVETALQYTTKINRLTLSIGGNATIQQSEILKYDELNYHNDYQKRLGKPADAYFGYIVLGQFKDDNDIANSPIQPFDDQLSPGDIKYKDMNGDGQVDANDRAMIGHTDPRLFYGLNLRLGYGNFDLLVVADGSAIYDLPMTNQYFWNGWGDNNYSEFVRDNIGGAYPRLTYNRVNNNFQSSEFWMTRADYLKIQNMELSYSLPQKLAEKMFTRRFRIYARGANLLTISKVKDVDPEAVHSGVYFYPLMRTITGGIRLTL